MIEAEGEKQRRFVQVIFSNINEARLAVQCDPLLLQVRNSVRETAFHYVVIENRIDLAQHLLGWGSDINTRDHSGATPLMHAVQLGCLDMVKWLISNGANIDLKDELEETALSKATRNNRVEVFDFLLSLPRKLDINFYYDDLTAQDVFDDKTLVMREALIRLGLSERNRE